MSRRFLILFIVAFLFSLSDPATGLEIPANDVVWDGNRAAPFDNHQQVRDNMVFDGVNLTIRAGTFVYHNQSLTSENEEFEGDPSGPFYLLFINGASLAIEGSEDQQVIFGRPEEGRDDPRSCSVYIHVESIGNMREVSDVGISHTQFWYGSTLFRSNPNTDPQLIEDFLGIEWNPEEPLDHFAHNTVDQNIFINVNRRRSRTPLFEKCYFHRIKLILRGEGRGDENLPDLLNNEFSSRQGGVAEYSPEYYSIALGSSFPDAPQPAQGFVIKGCEFYNSFEHELCNQMLQVSVDYVEGNPNVILDCYFHHAHESLVHVYSGHNIFRNCDFEHTSDACLKQVFRGGDNDEIRALMEVYNCRFNYYGDHAVYQDADGRDNFDLIMKNCIVTGNNGVGFMNNEEQVFASRDGSITIRGDALIENCTVYHNRQYGRREGMDVDRTAGIYIANSEYEFDVTIRNCIIYDNDIGVTYEVEPELENALEYCILNGNEFQTEGWENWNAEELHNSDSDPLFVDAENGDIHLLYNSPCINQGYSIAANDPDGSLNDLGIFGGPKADEFHAVRMPRFLHEQRGEDIEDRVFFENMDDYCLIGPDDIVLNRQRETTIYRDTYHLTGNLNVRQNDLLTIQPGTLIKVARGKGIDVSGGSIQINGSATRPINIQSLTENKWNGIRIDGNLSRSLLDHCNISNAIIGINFSDAGSAQNPAQLLNINVSKCDLAGIKIFNSRVAFGVDMAPNSWNYIKDCAEFGIIVSTSDPDDILITSTQVNNCGTGLILFDANPIIENCHIFENQGAGIVAHTGSLPNLTPIDFRANTICDNGDHEIKLYTGSNPTISNNNIIDIDGEAPDDLAIWAHFSNLPINAGGNFYGLPADQISGEWFSGPNILWDPPINERLPGIDGIDPDRRDLIFELWKADRFRDVTLVCNQILTDNNASENELIAATTYSRPAHKQAGDDPRELRDVLLDASDRFLGIQNNYMFERQATLCLVDLGFYRQALEEYEDRQTGASDNGNNLEKSLAEIDAIELKMAHNMGVNNTNSDEYKTRLFELYNSLEDTEQHLAQRDIDFQIPESPFLATAYPNPFNSSTTISYGIPKAANVRITICDISGRCIETLIDEEVSPGHYKVTWSPQDVSAGIYVVRLEAGVKRASLKVALIR